MSVEVDTSDLDRLARDFVAAGPRVQKASSASLTKIARELRDDAKNDVAVDTGDLKESIRTRGGKDYRVVYSDSRYAFFQEFGTSVMAPHPFMWNNARTAQESLTEAIERDSDPLK